MCVYWDWVGGGGATNVEGPKEAASLGALPQVNTALTVTPLEVIHCYYNYAGGELPSQEVNLADPMIIFAVGFFFHLIFTLLIAIYIIKQYQPFDNNLFSIASSYYINGIGYHDRPTLVFDQ